MTRILLIGAGGLGCAAGLALAASGLRLSITVIDPDRVERSNLHRQVLYRERDIGEPKAVLAARALGAASIESRAIVDRVGVGNAIGLLAEHDLVIEGTDRHEAKFLAADAAVIAERAIVHAGIVGWAGWALACCPRRGACLRCVFEEIPGGAAVLSCAENGVIGAAVGVLGAIQASLAAAWIAGEPSAGEPGAGGSGAAGQLVRYDARSAAGRASRVARREDCAVCGDRPSIRALDATRYAPSCTA